MEFIDIGDEARRQYINAKSVYSELESAKMSIKNFRGGMFWKKQGGYEYLIRTSTNNSQKSLGVRSDETELIFEKFISGKSNLESRISDLKDALTLNQKLNRAHQVGRAPAILIEILNALEDHQLSEYFTVIGTHALYAYESAAGVRILSADAIATQDVDLLWDTRKRVSFLAHMKKMDSSMVGLLKKVDPTFRIRSDQKYTAVNSKGFEVDIIRREAIDGDPHPIQTTENEDDFWVAQAKRANLLLDSEKFSAIIVSASGHMAKMTTVNPVTFCEFKKWMANQPDRDPLKVKRDIMQAQIVEELVREYLPNLLIKS